MSNLNGFLYTIDKENSDETHLYIDMPEGTVLIHKADEGLVIDVFPLNVVDAPVASTWVTYEMLYV